MKAICIEDCEVSLKNKYGAIVATVNFLENKEYEYEVCNINAYQYYSIEHPDRKRGMINCEFDVFSRYFKDNKTITSKE
jgi:hypothetical protein